jgi:hypothetical protein
MILLFFRNLHPTTRRLLIARTLRSVGQGARGDGIATILSFDSSWTYSRRDSKYGIPTPKIRGSPYFFLRHIMRKNGEGRENLLFGLPRISASGREEVLRTET